MTEAATTKPVDPPTLASLATARAAWIRENFSNDVEMRDDAWLMADLAKALTKPASEPEKAAFLCEMANERARYLLLCLGNDKRAVEDAHILMALAGSVPGDLTPVR